MPTLQIKRDHGLNSWVANKLESWIYLLAPTPKSVFSLQHRAYHRVIRSNRYVLTTFAAYQIISSRIIFNLEVWKEILFSNYQCMIVSFLLHLRETRHI